MELDVNYYRTLSDQAMFAYQELLETIRRAGYDVTRTTEGELILVGKKSITVRNARHQQI